MSVVVGNRKRIDKAISRLNRLAQKIIKPIAIDTFSRNGTAETAKASAVERELAHVYNAGLKGGRRAKIGNHIF